jgi:hypothetical protein
MPDIHKGLLQRFDYRDVWQQEHRKMRDIRKRLLQIFLGPATCAKTAWPKAMVCFLQTFFCPVAAAACGVSFF